MFLDRSKIEERTYQTSIFENTKDKNSLIVLPTGLGKTIISAMLIDYRLSEFPGSRALFLAPTKPLLNQHGKTLSRLMNLKLAVVSGSVSKAERGGTYKDNDLILATPQTIENDIASDLIDLSAFSIIIVDEAHHSIGNYAYVKVADEFLRRSSKPNIIGLTASPASDQGKIMEICKNLHISTVEIRGEDDSDVSPYIKTKIVQEERIELPKEIKSIIAEIKGIIADQVTALKGVGILAEVPASRINRVTILKVQNGLIKRLRSDRKSWYAIRGIIITSKILKLYHALNLVSTQSVEAFYLFLSRLMAGKAKSDKELAKSEAVAHVIESARALLDNGEETPKIERLKEILQKSVTKDKRAIVFTQYRDNVDVLYKYLSKMDGIRPAKFIGQGRKGLSQKNQLEIIRQFEEGTINVLISTSVSEEGISIKGVDTAVFYETVSSAIRMIQRKGRVGRFDVGKIYLLIAEDTNDEGYFWLSKRREKAMRKIVSKIKDNPSMITNDGTLRPFT